jgi:hypothetical protein
VRLTGDADSCAALGRELERAAPQVAEGGTGPARSLLASTLWGGTSAWSWRGATVRREERAEWLAEQLALAGRALLGFADQLVELQARAARLAAAASAEGLGMDPDGGIAPVPVLHGPYSSAEALVEQRRALQTAEVRSMLLHQVAALRADEDELHARFLRDLQSVRALGGIGPRRRTPETAPEVALEVERRVAPEAEREAERQVERTVESEKEASWWEPSGWNATAFLSLVKNTQLQDLSLSALPPARRVWVTVRTVPGIAVVSGVIGAVGDVQEGYSVKEAVLKETVVGVSSVAAGAGALALFAGAPAFVPVAATIVVGAGVGYGLGKAWDAVSKPEQDEEPQKEKTPRGPRPRPQFGPPVPRKGVPLPQDPTCGQGPSLAQVS